MDDFLLELLHISLLGSLSALLLLFLSRISHKWVSRSVIYYLWLLVLLRLCIPVGITVTLPSVSSAVSQSSHEMTDKEIEPYRHQEQKEAAVFTAKPVKSDDPVNTADTATIQQPYKLPDTNHVGMIVWGFGVLICLGWHFAVNLHFHHSVRRSVTEVSPEAETVLRELEPAGRVRLAGSSIVHTPMLLGVFHPVIVLPTGTKEQSVIQKSMERHDILKRKAFGSAL